MNKFTVANEFINANASLNLRDNFGKTALFYGDFIYWNLFKRWNDFIFIAQLSGNADIRIKLLTAGALYWIRNEFF